MLQPLIVHVRNPTFILEAMTGKAIHFLSVTVLLDWYVYCPKDEGSTVFLVVLCNLLARLVTEAFAKQ